MIKNFKSKTAHDVFNGITSRYARQLPLNLHGKAKRLFDQINASTKVETLRVPPGNNLEKLTGDLSDFWSVRINKQWRIIFKWEEGSAYDLDIVDYH
ncbi:MAG: type II toxin-antitoxin system RelE/ParE family toxin [Gammaproteobacteria bacterium]|nr:type II toxin-antitoxin system RelE/ParE family toxin [Gammaproteobacteria bacterium]